MMTWKGGKEPQSLYIGLITEGYFRMYGMQVILGRSFLPFIAENTSASPTHPVSQVG